MKNFSRTEFLEEGGGHLRLVSTISLVEKDKKTVIVVTFYII